ncbi:MAG: FAD-dependent thymidylate synthase [Nitrososphaerota archaeon]|nr:FAD-dependent thymidylate synthase [Nitrososphaerota archaeon]
MKAINVLDKGYVSLTHTTKSTDDDKIGQETLFELDKLVVESARTSTGGELKGDEKDRKLLHYLIEHEHVSPLEMPTFRFELKVPLFIVQQLLRHRWSSFNQLSARYTENISEEFHAPDRLRSQDTKNKQGSILGDVDEITLDEAEFYMSDVHSHKVSARSYLLTVLRFEKQAYDKLIAAHVAKEQARLVLGPAFYTKLVWSVNARSLINFLILRLDPHAQWETQEYARAICKLFEEEMPWTFDALTKVFPSVSWKNI